MATAEYSALNSILPTTQESPLPALVPVSLSGTEINASPDLPATIKVDGIEAHYFAAPNQVIVPGMPVILFLSPEPSANDNDKTASLPKRLRAGPGSGRGKLKLAHTPPPQAISVASRFVEQQIKHAVTLKALEYIPTQARQPLPTEDRNHPQQRLGFSRRAELKTLHEMPPEEPTPEANCAKRSLKHEAKLIMLELILAA